MTFIIKLFDKTEIEVSDQDLTLLKGREGLIWIPSAKQAINTSTISQIVPKELYEERIDRSEQREGMLHDGTKVVKYFGQWCIAGEVDEHGKPLRYIDPQYYPEVAKDCVPTTREYYKEYAHLPLPQRKVLISGRGREKSDFVRLDGNFKQITQ